MDEYMKRTGKTYAEVMEEAEDQYAQMEIDRIRGKWFLKFSLVPWGHQAE